MSKLKILCFAPHAAIWEHAFPEAVMLKSLQDSGHQVVYVTCDRQMPHLCVSMESFKLTFESPLQAKQRVCDYCQINATIAKRQFGFRGYDYGQFVKAEDAERVTRTLNEITPSNLLDAKFAGLEVGRIALHDYLLRHKQIVLEFTPEQWKDYTNTLRNVLSAILALQRIFDQEQPDRVMVYNPMYSVNRACCKLAELREIPVYWVHGGRSLVDSQQNMMLTKGTSGSYGFYKNIISHWPKYADQPVSHQSLRKVTQHARKLIKGGHHNVFSSTKSNSAIRAKFGVAPHKKLVTALMSSYDEQLAYQLVGASPSSDDLLFPRQLDWIDFLIDYFGTQPDKFLIIRVHPREFRGRRSEHSLMLEARLKHLPDNIKVNWPSDQLSIYDLAEETDVFLNAWSSTGKEMTMLGLPVVIYSDVFTPYPADLNYIGTDKETYVAKIEEALHDGWDGERIRKTYRWYVHELERSEVDLASAVPSDRHLIQFVTHGISYVGHKVDAIPQLIAKPMMAIWPWWNIYQHKVTPQTQHIINDVIVLDKVTLLDLDQLPQPETHVLPDHEMCAVKQEVKRLMRYLYTQPQEVQSEDTLKARLFKFVST